MYLGPTLFYVPREKQNQLIMLQYSFVEDEHSGLKEYDVTKLICGFISAKTMNLKEYKTVSNKGP